MRKIKSFNENYEIKPQPTTYSADLTTDEKKFINDFWDLVAKYKYILSVDDIERILKDYNLFPTKYNL